jgi:hypothetical protein
MDLRRRLSASYRRLDDDAARLFRRLAPRSAAPIPLAVAAALADVPVARCRHLLADLVAESLLSEPVAGSFRMHEFVADYAHETCDRTDPAAERSAAVDRPRGLP